MPRKVTIKVKSVRTTRVRPLNNPSSLPDADSEIELADMSDELEAQETARLAVSPFYANRHSYSSDDAHYS